MGAGSIHDRWIGRQIALRRRVVDHREFVRRGLHDGEVVVGLHDFLTHARAALITGQVITIDGGSVG
jgi:NAD(P)-dependent dehydrogenase (short-subunit alcohol dehydrogenase family)